MKARHAKYPIVPVRTKNIKLITPDHPKYMTVLVNDVICNLVAKYIIE